jgi:hypothetical protein
MASIGGTTDNPTAATVITASSVVVTLVSAFGVGVVVGVAVGV